MDCGYDGSFWHYPGVNMVAVSMEFLYFWNRYLSSTSM